MSRGVHYLVGFFLRMAIIDMGRGNCRSFESRVPLFWGQVFFVERGTKMSQPPFPLLGGRGLEMVLSPKLQKGFVMDGGVGGHDRWGCGLP